MDVENLDALNPTELDELLERALNPRVPVEVLYAVLDRIGPAKDGAPAAATAATVAAAATAATAAAAAATADAEETTVLPPLVSQLQAQVHQLPQPQPHPQAQPPTRGAATDRAVRPERPNQKQAAPQQKSPNPNPQPAKPGQQPPNPGQQQPKTASPAVHPSRGAHAPTRRVAPPPGQESGK
jgi:hypothetical protein